MKRSTLVLCFLLTSGQAALATETATVSEGLVGNAEAGKAKSSSCMACHGPDGNSVAPMYPKIAGQGAAYIADQLRAFKDGVRKDPVMSPMAKPLSEQDIVDIATHYASQKMVAGKAKEETLEQGQKIYRGGLSDKGVPACMACHGPNGAGNPAAKYPTIGGQHADYTQKQLKDYVAKARGESSNAVMMSEIAAKMTPEEMKAVAEYLVGLH